jgi:hypothetical protein
MSFGGNGNFNEGKTVVCKGSQIKSGLIWKFIKIEYIVKAVTHRQVT